MKFLRLTSVFLCFALLSSFLTLSVSAVDDMDYYSLPPVGGSEPSAAMDWPVNPAEFSNSDSQTLTNIYKYIQYLTLSPASWQSNSIIGFLDRILDAIPSNLGTNFALQGSNRGTNVMLDEIAKWTMFSYNYLSSDNIAGNLGNIQRNTAAIDDRILSSNTLLGSINDSVSGINGFVKEDSFQSALGNVFLVTGSDAKPTYSWSLARFLGSVFAVTNNGILDTRYSDSFQYNIPWYDPNTHTYHSLWGSWSAIMGQLVSSLGVDGQASNLGYAYTLYHYVKNLSETLASEDDKQLAENYKENREQAEQDFLNGKSGKTSLGKDDFGSLSSVGGTFKDTISLNGQSSLSDLTSGLADADSAGQGWFSQATKDSLDAVSGSGSSESTVSTFSDDGFYSVDVDPDPYHMQGFEDNYAWLWGDD